MDGVLRATTYPRKLSLKEFDFLSEGKGINVAGEESNKSYVGAFASVGVYTVLTLACIYYLNQFLDETGPQVQFLNFLDSKASTFRAGSMGTQFYFLLGNPVAKLKMVNATTTYDPNKDQGDNFDPEADPYTNPPPTTAGDGSDGTPVPPDPTDPTDPGNTDPTPIVQGRRRLQTSTNSYLKHSELSRYFNASLRQEIIQFGFSGQDDFRVVSVIDRKLIPCADSAWYQNKRNQKFMQTNAFLYNLVGKYGICFDVDDKTQIYGDPLSVKSSRLRFTLEYCDSTTITGCLDNTLQLLRENMGIDIVVGTFEPSIDATNKSSPWTFDLTSDVRLTLDILATATVTATMKNITVLTDNGLVIEDITQESFGVPKQLITQYAPSFQFGKDLEAISGDPNDKVQYSVTYGVKDLTYFDFRLTSSRYNEVYKRTYMTILDLFGNIGGTVEFIIVLFLLLFHWYENVQSQITIREELRKKFALPENFVYPDRKLWCCRKHKLDRTSTASTNQAKQIPYHSLAKDALDEIGDSALNLERLAVHDTTATVLLESLVPKPILHLAPVVSVIKRMVEINKAEREKKAQQQKKADKDSIPLPAQPAAAEGQQLKHKQVEETDSVDLGQAYDWLHQEGNDQGIFKPVVQDMRNAFQAFGAEFGVSDVKLILASSSNTDKGGLQDTTQKIPVTNLTIAEDLRRSISIELMPAVPILENRMHHRNQLAMNLQKPDETSKSQPGFEEGTTPTFHKRLVPTNL